MKTIMKKIECLVSKEKDDFINAVCDKEGYTRAEFNRRAVELYIKSLEGQYWQLIKKGEKQPKPDKN